MSTYSVKTKFFEFNQNNSGGNFIIDKDRGIGETVWIEALNSEDANNRAETIGIYFDGCSSGRDCSCCGDRWFRAWKYEGQETPFNNSTSYPAYVHYISGNIEEIKEIRRKK